MKKFHALLLSFLITGLIASNIYLFSLLNPKVRETAIVSRVIDGDTLELNDKRIIRLANINAPEKDAPSTNFLKFLENKTIELEIIGSDKYSRNLARIYIPEYLNLKIVSLGFASKFLVHDSEIKEFSKAEQNAIENSLGIWNHSVYYNCFTTQIDKYNEIIKLINNCEEINLEEWGLKDESTRFYTFPSVSLGEISLHSNLGEDNATDLFWNSKTNIWNNDRDTLYLFDQEGGLVHHESYGY